jgi:hypothetical protein
MPRRDRLATDLLKRLAVLATELATGLLRQQQRVAELPQSTTDYSLRESQAESQQSLTAQPSQPQSSEDDRKSSDRDGQDGGRASNASFSQ